MHDIFAERDLEQTGIESKGIQEIEVGIVRSAWPLLSPTLGSMTGDTGPGIVANSQIDP